MKSILDFLAIDVEGSSLLEILRFNNFIRWFHFSCVGIDDRQVPGEWHCDQCLVWKQISQRTQDEVSSHIEL